MKTAKNTPKFLLFTFIISWLVWGGMIVLPLSEKWFIPLLFLGAFGPTLAAVFLVQTSGNSAVKKDFWKRVVDIRLIGWKYLLFIFLIFPIVLAAGYFILFLMLEEMPKFSSYFSGLNNFEAVVFFLIFMLLGGPLAEELGWRGYLLDPLQEKWGEFKGSILLGFFWLLWHLPLFLSREALNTKKDLVFPFGAGLCKLWSFR